MDNKTNSQYPLEKRTYDFSKAVINNCRVISNGLVNQDLVRQVLKSATSIRANYREANGAISRDDFRSKVFICKKESQETLYWLLLIQDTIPGVNFKKEIKEAEELVKIFGKICSTLKKK